MFENGKQRREKFLEIRFIFSILHCDIIGCFLEIYKQTKKIDFNYRERGEERNRQREREREREGKKERKKERKRERERGEK